MKLEDRYRFIVSIDNGLTVTEVVDKCIEISNTETIGFAQFLKEQCIPLSGDRWNFNTNHYTITELLKIYQDLSK